MSSPGSVSMWFTRLKGGERSAFEQLWHGYFQRLVNLARSRLRDVPRQVADAEDVALSAFDSFIRAVQRGRFPDLEDRDDFWQILVMLASRKAVNLVRQESARKKGGGKVRHVSALAADTDDGPAFAQLLGRGPDPAQVLEITQECERLLKSLPDEQYRRIALAKLEGYSNEEIAGQINKSVATVECKLKRHPGVLAAGCRALIFPFGEATHVHRPVPQPNLWKKAGAARQDRRALLGPLS